MTLITIALLLSLLCLFLFSINQVQHMKISQKLADMRLQVLSNRKVMQDALRTITQPAVEGMMLPTLESYWVHHNGNTYKVLHIANEHSEDTDKYPITVVYQGSNGRIWSRPLDKWFDSFTAIP